MVPLAVWAVEQSSSWKTEPPGSKRMPTIISAARLLITPAQPSSTASLVTKCGLKAYRSFTSIRSGVDDLEGRGRDSGRNFRLRSPAVQVEPDRMLHALIAQLDWPRLH